MFADHICVLVVRVSGYRSSGPEFDSQRYQIFWEVMDLERGPLSLKSTSGELLGRKSSGSILENWEYSHRYLLRWPRDTIYPQKMTLILLTSRGRSVDIVHSRTQATEFANYIPVLAMNIQELLAFRDGVV
jgi:hypothetical protein